jgi:predicted transcriptional regulator
MRHKLMKKEAQKERVIKIIGTGLDAAKAGRTLSHSEVEKRIKALRKQRK